MIADVFGFGPFKIIGWLVIVAMAVLIPISRMYLGAHSANQVVMGLLLGLIFCVLYHYFFQRILYNYFWKLINKRIKIIQAIVIFGI